MTQAFSLELSLLSKFFAVPLGETLLLVLVSCRVRLNPRNASWALAKTEPIAQKFRLVILKALCTTNNQPLCTILNTLKHWRKCYKQEPNSHLTQWTGRCQALEDMHIIRRIKNRLRTTEARIKKRHFNRLGPRKMMVKSENPFYR